MVPLERFPVNDRPSICSLNGRHQYIRFCTAHPHLSEAQNKSFNLVQTRNSLSTRRDDDFPNCCHRFVLLHVVHFLTWFGLLGKESFFCCRSPVSGRLPPLFVSTQINCKLGHQPINSTKLGLHTRNSCSWKPSAFRLGNGSQSNVELLRFYWTRHYSIAYVSVAMNSVASLRSFPARHPLPSFSFAWQPNKCVSNNWPGEIFFFLCTPRSGLLFCGLETVKSLKCPPSRRSRACRLNNLGGLLVVDWRDSRLDRM